IEGKNPTGEILHQHPFHGFGELVAPLSGWQRGEAEAEFRFGDGADEQGGRRLCSEPAYHVLSRRRLHQLGKDVRVEEDHRSKRGGLRIGSRGISGSSTPPRGANLAWMADARFAGRAGSRLSALRRMSRASSSIERPCVAARMRKRALSGSS